MYSSVSAGKNELYHKTCGTLRSSRSSRTGEREATATATEAPPFSASLIKSLQRSSWSDCRSRQNVFPESQCSFPAGRPTIDMVFSLRQLQEKCREQQMPLYITSIDLTKAYDHVSRNGLFQILPKIGCSPKLQSMIESLHTNMQPTVQFNSSSSRPFDICSSVKQGCVLAPTLFEIFFTLLLRHTFGTASE